MRVPSLRQTSFCGVAELQQVLCNRRHGFLLVLRRGCLRADDVSLSAESVPSIDDNRVSRALLRQALRQERSGA